MGIEMNLEEWRQDKNAKSLSYFSIKESVHMSKELIEKLKKISEENDYSNARLSFHASPEEVSLHDMIVLEYQDKKCRKPHKHLEKEETLHMIEGVMVSFIFDEKGNLIEKTIIDAEHPAYRASRNRYHVWLPFTNRVIYREIKQGPFKQEDNVPPRFDYIAALKKNVDFMDLGCNNANCKSPCALNNILRKKKD